MLGRKLTLALLLVFASQAAAAPTPSGGAQDDTAADALKAAQAAYNEAKDSAVKELAKLDAHRKHVDGLAAEDELERLEKKAQQLVEADASAAKKDLDKTLERVHSSSASFPSMQDVDDVKKSAHAVFDMERAKGKVLMGLWKQDAKEQVQAARVVGQSAVKAIQAEHKAARKLEDAQRKAGVPESVFERQYQESERLSEHMEGVAEQSRDRLADAVESFYSKLEHKIEAKTDVSNDKALQNMEDIISSLLSGNAKKVPEAAGKGKEKSAEQKSADSTASKTDSSPNQPAAGPQALAAMREQGENAAKTSVMTMAGLAVVGLGAVALAYVKRPSRVIKDAPPLLG